MCSDDQDSMYDCQFKVTRMVTHTVAWSRSDSPLAARWLTAHWLLGEPGLGEPESGENQSLGRSKLQAQPESEQPGQSLGSHGEPTESGQPGQSLGSHRDFRSKLQAQGVRFRVLQVADHGKGPFW